MSRVSVPAPNSGHDELNSGSGRPPLRHSNSSIFGAIKSLVSIPLTWLSNDTNNSSDSHGEKRPHTAANGIAVSDQSGEERVSKRQRLHSPPLHEQTRRIDGLPLETTSPGYTRAYSQPINGYTPMPAPLPLSLSRTSTLISDSATPSGSSWRRGSRPMSLDPTPSARSHEFSINTAGSSPRRSLSRGLSIGAGPPSPYRMRTSLTPQATALSLSPTRREFSAAPSSLIWPTTTPRSSMSPVRDFRREASAPAPRKQLVWDPATGITTKDEFERSSRTKTSTASTPAERALEALESFRKPLVPPSFASDPAAPSYLSSSRKYAPPPLPVSVINTRANGGHSQSVKSASSLTGKTARMIRPYSGEGGMKKLLKKRALEREKDLAESSKAPLKETSMQTDSDMMLDSPLAGKKAEILADEDSDELDFLTSAPTAAESDVIHSSLSTSTPQKAMSGGRVSASRAAAPSRPKNPNAPSSSTTSSLRAESVKHRVHGSSARKAKFAIPEDEEDVEIDPHLQGLPSKQDLVKNGAALTFEIPSGFSFKPSPASTSTTPPVEESPSVAEVKPAEKVSAMSPASDPPAAVVNVRPSPVPTQSFEAPSPFSFAPPPNPPVLSSTGKDQPVKSLPFSLTPPSTASGSSTGGAFASLKQLSANKDGSSTPSALFSFAPSPLGGSLLSAKPSPPVVGITPPTPETTPKNVETSKPTAELVSPAITTNPFAATPAVAKSELVGISTPGPVGNVTTKSTPMFFTSSLPSSSIAPAQEAVGSTLTPSPSGVAPPTLFGKSPAAAAPSTLFGKTPTADSNKPEAVEKGPSLISPFSFGSPAKSSGPSISAPPSTIQQEAPLDSTKAVVISTSESPAKRSLFAFGAAPATPPANRERPNPFASTGPDVGTSPAPPIFSFGTPTTEVPKDRAKTPERPKNTDMMDESPSRDTSSSDAKPAGFSFTSGGGFGSATQAPPTSFTFGAPKPALPTSSPSPFPFGSSTPASNGFGAKASDNETANSPGVTPAPFTFGTPSVAQPPSTTPAPFSFGTPAPEASGTASRGASPFSFGGNQGGGTPFGASAQSNPFSSPLQTPQPLPTESRGTTPFSFQSPTSAPHNPFNFTGSQPSSPAITPSGLPTTNGPTPAFQFGPPAGSGENNLFTIGSAPPPARNTKGLPKRRGATRR